MSFLSGIQSFSKGGLKKTTTRVRTRDGKLFEETIADGELKATFKGSEPLPSYLSENSDGFSMLHPASFDADTQTWKPRAFGCLPCLPAMIRFVTYNVWFADFHKSERAHSLISTLSTLSPDIVCLQEATEGFLDILKSNDFIRQNYILSDAAGLTVYPYGNLILSKFPISQLGIHKLPTNQGRRFLTAEFTVGGETIRVGTVHLESLDNADMRVEQLEIIFPTFEKSDHQFFMGDMNFGDSSESETRAIPQRFSDIGAGERLPTCGPSRLDRVFAFSPKYRNEKFVLIGKEPIDSDPTSADWPVFTSDHWGLCADFVL